MATTLPERTTERTTGRAADRAAERTTWHCPNCQGQTDTTRKRCRDCGTSRF